MGVKLVEKIRKSKGYNAWAMCKALGISPTQYRYMEKTAQSIRIDMLIELYKISDMSVVEFWKLIEDEVKGMKPKSRGPKAKI